jgi:hypothetical protein
MESDLVQTTSANTEINVLTNRLETTLPTERKAPEFQQKLEALVEHLETQIQPVKSNQIRSFTNQPERVNISSDSDISFVQSQDALNEQNFSSFKVSISRPFLDVKSIQLLRASIPNAVTNIPDEECTFWYYRLPAAIFSGTISVTNQYSNATFTTAGVITPAVLTATLVSITPSFPAPGLATYFLTNLTSLINGSTVTVAGVTPSGYNGTFVISDISIPNVSFRVVNATTGAANVASSTLTQAQTITDTINWNTVPYSLQNAAGDDIGYFRAPSSNGGTVSIFTSNTLTGGTIGTITRSGDLFIEAPSFEYLHMIRLLPSYYKTELFNSSQGQNTNLPPASTYGFNRTFRDYQDLASELSKSCLNDPAYDLADSFPIFTPGDISITFNETLNKFIFTGNNAFSGGFQFATYLSAGYEDPNLWVDGPIQDGNSVISAPTLSAYSIDFPGDYYAVRGIRAQPYRINRTLNLRLGFTWNGIVTGIAFPLNADNLTNPGGAPSVFVSFLNRLRPSPDYFVASSPPLLNATNPSSAILYTADSYANLVYTNTVSILADFTGGSTYDSISNTLLLACVPMNASNLGVTFYNATLNCPLTKISDQIYEIEIRMLTDTGAPYSIPNSCIVSLELALTY